MKEKNLFIITILMTIAVVGLISIQIYFINNAFMVEELRFDENARELLRDVIRKAEKLHAAKLIINKINSGKNNFVYMSKDSSADKIFSWNVNHPNPALPPTKFDIDVKTILSDSSKKTIRIIKRTNKKIDLSTKNHLDSIVFGKQKLVTEIVDELVTIKPNMIDSKLFDSLIHIELNNRGLDLKYYFVLTDFNGNILYSSDSLMNEKIVKSKIRIALPPSDFFSPPNSLIILFSDKYFFIAKSTTLLLILSFVIIAVIILLFYKTVKMFLMQKKINEVKNDLINNITHEFKTPISTISLACDMLSDVGNQTPPTEKYLSIIKDENTRLQKMVEILLSNAALEKGELLLQKQDIDLYSLLTALVDKFLPIIEQKNGSLILQSEIKSCLYRGDEFHLSAAFSNIIENSIKYNINTPEILITITKSLKSLTITILDNGIGISKTEIKKIFNTFYRISTGNIHNIRGYGIGLSYTKKIIEMHEGTISIESQLNKGSSFTITLPYEQN